MTYIAAVSPDVVLTLLAESARAQELETKLQVAEAEVTRLRQEREGQTAWAVVVQEQSDPNKELIRVYASREFAEASLQPGEHVEEWPYAVAAPTREEP